MEQWKFSYIFLNPKGPTERQVQIREKRRMQGIRNSLHHMEPMKGRSQPPEVHRNEWDCRFCSV
jgi:hypothetical protein